MMLDYNNAKLEKLKELKKLMYELLAAEGDDVELSADDVDESLEEASLPAEESESDLQVDDGSLLPDEEEEDELTKMKREYFSPKRRDTSRPGTASVILSKKTPKASMAAEVKKALPSKKRRY